MSDIHLDLEISSPMLMAWVADASLYMVTREGILCSSVTKSQSQPDMKVKFADPAVASYIGGDMSSLLVILENMIALTISIETWAVVEEYQCPGELGDYAPLWVCLLPTQWLGHILPSTAQHLCVVGGGATGFITDGTKSKTLQMKFQTRGQFLTQFLPQHSTRISSLTSLASVLHHQDTGELSSRLLLSSVKDIVMCSDMLALLTKEGEIWKMESQNSELMPSPLLSCVDKMCVVGGVMTAVTSDFAVYVFNMREGGQVVGKVEELNIRNKGHILESIVEETQRLENINKDLIIMKERLNQLKIFHQLRLADSSRLFKTELSPAAAASSYSENCLKVNFKNVSDFELSGKFWSLKIDICLDEEKCSVSKTVPLPPTFSVQESIRCVIPLPHTALVLPLSVRSHLVFREDRLPTLLLHTNTVTALDLLTMSGVGRRETGRNQFYKSLGIGGATDERDGEDHKESFSVDRKKFTAKRNKIEEIITCSENIPTVWNCLDKAVEINADIKGNSDKVTIAGGDKALISDIRKEMAEGFE